MALIYKGLERQFDIAITSITRIRIINVFFIFAIVHREEKPGDRRHSLLFPTTLTPGIIHCDGFTRALSS